MNTKLGTWMAAAALIVALLTATSVAVAGPRLLEQAAGAPTVVSYQGKVMLGGAPYSGTGYFKFAFVNAAGDASYWSNNGSSTAGSEPTAAVQLTVANGLFTVLLGDTNLTNMTQPLEASVFSGTERYLRVWFSSDNVTYTQLTPDQRVATVPYALQAQNADLLDGLDSSAFQPFESTRYYPLQNAQSVDMEFVDSRLKGYLGGFTDGRYAYFAPFYDGSAHFGRVARLDLQDFSVTGVTDLDLAAVNPGLKGFHGAFTDGRYGYFVPFYNGSAYSGMIARVDLQNFTLGGVTILDLTQVNSSLKCFWGGFAVGRYGYFVPNKSGPCYAGALVRVDLQNFTTTGVTTLDLVSIDSGLQGFAGGFTDGRYGYLVPDRVGSVTKTARVDLENFNAGGVTVLDWAGLDSNLTSYNGGFTNGRYAYYVPYFTTGYNPNGKVIRINLQDFSTSGVTILDLEAIDAGLSGFGGGFSDGRYAYFVPGYPDHGKLARIDQQNFTPSGVTWLDLAAYDSAMTGFWGCFNDSRYLYLVPYNNWTDHLIWSGKVGRIPLFDGGSVP